jgi:hypothetical protein
VLTVATALRVPALVRPDWTLNGGAVLAGLEIVVTVVNDFDVS